MIHYAYSAASHARSEYLICQKPVKMAKHFLIRFGVDSGRHVLGKVSTVEILQQAEALLALGDVIACAKTCGRST